MSLICVPIIVHDLAPALADAAAARDGGADLVEFRIDECFSGSGDAAEEKLIHELTAQSPLPCIITCRSAKEGGAYDGDEMERVSLYERLVLGGDVVHPPRYLDIELDAYSASANIRQKIDLAVQHPGQVREVSTGLILSLHDFTTRPADLSRRVLKAAAEPAAAVVKIAYRARSLLDSLELLDLPAHLQRPTIALGMGDFGVITRLLAPKFGGFLTFAALRQSSATAPGQPTLSELLNTYRFRQIKPSTSVYGVVGWPVTHSASPIVHNAGFDAVGHDGVYVQMPIAAGEDGEASYASFKGTMLELIDHPHLTFRGCSITLPHKENALRLARAQGWDVEHVAETVGAANTLVIERPEGCAPRIKVTNTDAPALVACLCGVIESLEGKHVAVVGAGGVARAAVAGCIYAGARVTVYNRTLEKAEILAASLRSRIRDAAVAARPLEALLTEPADALVQCTSVGMNGGPDPQGIAAPLEQMKVHSPNLVVMDTVYNPIRTPLLREAERLGLRHLDGVGMFVAQAAMQFDLWTGKRAPLALFERIVRERM
jgi:3-dehydroquinate dehydratase/shikimate dehydrogenase